MLHIVIYNLLLAWTCLYAAKRGGAPERIGASTMAVGTLLTVLVRSPEAHRYDALEIWIFIVDLLALAAFVILAVLADRFWTIWIAALQTTSIIGHLMRLLDPNVSNRGYKFALAYASHLMCVFIIAGTWRHSRRLAQSDARPWKAFYGSSTTLKRESGPTR